MKISDKTMAAVEKAAASEKMSVDSWADRALARAASLGKKSNMETLLGDISRKLDDIAERQSFGEKANEQLAAAVSELGTSFEQIRKTTGRVFGQVRSRTGSAVNEIAERARDVIGQVSRSASELAGNLAPKAAVEEEAVPEPAAPKKRKTTAKRRSPGGQASGTARRGSSPRKGAKRGSSRRAT